MLTLSKFVLRFISSLLFLSFAVLQPTTAQTLPSDVEVAIHRAKIPLDAMSLYVIEANPSVSQPVLSYQPLVPMNPASVMKLVTSIAALDLLGPAYTWQTQVFVDGSIRDGVLDGNLIIRGGGDPKLVVERLWLLLRRVQSLGIQSIHGDIILDNSVFDVLPSNSAAFDGESNRPYNVSPDALLVNFKSVVLTFTVNPAAGVASVAYDPPLYGVNRPSAVPLSSANCSDYRASLRADFSDPKQIRFAGSYPRACGERSWSIAYADPASFASRAILGLWRSMGGELAGQTRQGLTPVGMQPSFILQSPTLVEVLRDMNKFSNNVMAEQLFLTLSMSPRQPANFQASREVLTAWWKTRYANQPRMLEPVIENGAGLSRTDRISAFTLARMLQDAFAAPFMPELISSLPIVGIDGTMRRSQAVANAAHLKTGTLNNVVARAGYVDAHDKRYVLVAIINSNNTTDIANAHIVFDSLINWVVGQ